MITERIVNCYNDINDTHLSLPNILRIELSSRCNHHCKFCVTAHEHHANSFMSSNVINRIIEEAIDCNIREIGLFHMGESMLHPEFNHIIQTFTHHLKNCRFYISTNGSIYNGIKCCIDNNIDSIKISLNCMSRQQHYEYTDVDDFCTIVDNIKKSFEYRNEVNSKSWLSFSSICSNITETDNTFIQKMSQYADEHYLTPMYNHAGKVDIASMTNSQCQMKIVDTSARYPCVAMFNMCHIKSNGDINLCRFGVDDKHTVGNIMTQSLRSIWFSGKSMGLRNLAKMHMLNTCNKCIHVS